MFFFSLITYNCNDLYILKKIVGMNVYTNSSTATVNCYILGLFGSKILFDASLTIVREKVA